MSKDREIAEASAAGPWYTAPQLCSVPVNVNDAVYVEYWKPKRVLALLDEIERIKAVETDARDALERTLAAVCMWAAKGHADWCTWDTEGCICGHLQAVKILEKD
jgi:hypothetical protein